MRHACKLVVAILTLLLLQSTFAVQIKPPSAWSGTAQFGYTGTGGNSDDNNISGKFNILWKKKKWTDSYKLETLFSNAKGETTAERYASTLEFNYNFKPRIFSFLRNNSVFDKFSPYDVTSSTSLGYGTRLYNGDTVTLDVQGGPGYRYSQVNESTNERKAGKQDLIGYLSTTMNWQISKIANLQEAIEVNSATDNTITSSETALSTDIIGNLGMQVSFSVTHNSAIPEGSTSLKHTDYRTDVTLLFSF